MEAVARAIYAQPDLEAGLDLVGIAIRAPDATLCLASALALHDISDEIPARIDVALPRRRRQPRTTAPVNRHPFDEATFNLDRHA